MLTRSIEQAINDRAGEFLAGASLAMDGARRDANSHAELFRQDVNDRIEIGTYVLAGAIVTGLVLAALILRTSAGS